jgi:hypothetical protein
LTTSVLVAPTLMTMTLPNSSIAPYSLECHQKLATKFAGVDRIKKQLARKGITSQPPICLSFSKAFFKATGTYEFALNNFEAKPATD